MAEKITSKLASLIQSRRLFRTIINKPRRLRLAKNKDKYSEREYLEKMSKLHLNYTINLDNPKTYNEKIQWLKLFWTDEHAKICADKYAVRDYIKEKGLSEHLVPLIGVFNNFDEIDFEALPNKFVVKINNDSGGVFICKNKNKYTKDKLLKEIKKKVVTRDYNKISREWVYKDIVPKIIIESLIDTLSGSAPIDYKFFCFHGEPKFLFIATNRDTDTRFDFFDLEWNRIPVVNGHIWSREIVNKPHNFEEMLEVARILSTDFPHVRVDLYSEQGKIYFGELTFFHYSGWVPFYPQKYDIEFGNYLNLAKIRNGNNV